MKKAVRKILPVLLLVGCGVIVELDISDEDIVLVSPAEGTTVEGPEVTFSWDEVEGATGYEIRVVRPTFEAISELELDTAVGEQLTITIDLERGDYQWSARGVNSEYETERVIRNFSVTEQQLDTLIRIRDKDIILISPSDNSTITESTTVLFKWEEVDGAEDYKYSIYEDLDSDDPIVQNAITQETEFSRTFEDRDADYRWEIRARNAIDSTDVFTFKFKIDVTEASE